MPKKLEPIQWRICKSLGCEELKGINCKAEGECIHPDISEALKERREQLKEGKKHD